MKKNFYEAVKDRRSIYGISKEITISEDRIVEVINDAVKYTPSAFNSQSGRVIVLMKEQHNRFWNIAEAALRKVVPEESFSSTKEKIDSFRNGYGTILFFEDFSVVKSLQNQFPLYKDNFPGWSQHSSGMLQYIVWTSLEVEGVGATLQHYNELVEEDINKEWNIPSNWKLIAQMPFGNPLAPAGDKEYMPLKDRVKVFN